MGALDQMWPLFQLRLHTGEFEMRLPDDSDLAALASLAAGQIHDPADMPFSVPWTDQPSEQRARGTLQWHWKCRAEWAPDDWRLELVAVRGREVVGTQSLHAKEFATRREVETGSWVGGRYQGHGVATAMRQSVMALAFSGLGADSARSGAFTDNSASLRVSEKLGYVTDGTEVYQRRGERSVMVRQLLTRQAWQDASVGWPSVVISGLEPCRSLFGLDGDVAQP